MCPQCESTTPLPSRQILSDWLLVAKTAAQEAGKLLKEAQGTSVVVEADPERDVKLEVDRLSEAKILDVLSKGGAFDILSEENGLTRGKERDQGYRWIVDPLDGSVNYLRGIPLCCVSVALWRNSEPLLGVVYNFIHDEMFTGLQGYGAELNRGRIEVSATGDPRKAVLCTGFPSGTDFSATAITGFAEQVRSYKKVRLLGTAALSMAYVAAGRADAYYERDIKIWDVAAGLVLVRAAGGRVLVTESAEAESVTVYADNAVLPHLVRAGQPPDNDR